MARKAVEVRGLKEFRRELKRFDSSLGKQIRLINLRVSEMIAGRARGAAPSKVAGAIGAKATQKAAQMTIAPKPPRAFGVFFGAKGRFGWYSHPRYRQSSARQFEPWIGANWDIGSGTGPYFIGRAINDSIGDAIDIWGDEIERLAADAFPD